MTVYEDAAISGASTLSRPGFQHMMLDAQAGQFDVVVTEGIDRLGRNLSDLAGCFDQLSFRRIQLHTISHGHVTQIHVGVMGMMAQMHLSDLAEKIPRSAARWIGAPAFSTIPSISAR